MSIERLPSLLREPGYLKRGNIRIANILFDERSRDFWICILVKKKKKKSMSKGVDTSSGGAYFVFFQVGNIGYK